MCVKMNIYFGLLFLVFVSAFSLNAAYALPLESVSTNVVEYDGTDATVELTWNHNGASYYETGCVSCIPNYSENTKHNIMILNNVTPFVDGSALLYIIAYDKVDEILTAKQVIIGLN